MELRICPSNYIMSDPNNLVFYQNILTPLWNDHPDFSLNGTTALWRVQVQQFSSLLPDFLRVLSEEEIRRSERYHRKQDAVRFIVGKGMLRIILSRYLDHHPAEIIFAKSFNKKPRITPPVGLEFNVSYSKEWIIVAVAAEPTGVDIEFIDPTFDYELVMDNWFTKEEKEYITFSPTPHASFFSLWTRKEALLKATSLGLNDYLKDFSCLDGTQPLPPQVSLGNNWDIKSFIMDGDYSISVARENLTLIKTYSGDKTML